MVNVYLSACVHTCGVGGADANVNPIEARGGCQVSSGFFVFVFLAGSFHSPGRCGYRLRAEVTEWEGLPDLLRSKPRSEGLQRACSCF